MNNDTKVTAFAVKSSDLDKYCSMQTKYSEAGTLTPNCISSASAHRFAKRILAMNAIKRTYEARDMVLDSMYATWPAMDDLTKLGGLEVVEITE